MLMLVEMEMNKMDVKEKQIIKSWQELALGDKVFYFAEEEDSFIEAQVVGVPRREESPIIIVKTPFRRSRGSIRLDKVKVYC
jgi:hypothetical protein